MNHWYEKVSLSETNFVFVVGGEENMKASCLIWRTSVWPITNFTTFRLNFCPPSPAFVPWTWLVISLYIIIQSLLRMSRTGWTWGRVVNFIKKSGLNAGWYKQILWFYKLSLALSCHSDHKLIVFIMFSALYKTSTKVPGTAKALSSRVL